MFRFESLKVFDESIIFSTEIYKLTRDWPKSETYGLTDQIRRAAVSISLNIAEGSSRTKKDFGHFLDLSRGSCFECVAAMKIAKANNYLSVESYTKFYMKCEQISKMLSLLKNSVLKL